MISASSVSSFRQQRFYLFITATIAALGGFLFGYDTGVISGALVFIKQTYPISVFMQEVVVSSVVFGALLGAIFSGRLTDILGSRTMLIWMAMTFIVGTLLSMLAINIYLLILGRLIIGIAIGITSYLSPLFIAEMAPAKHRGMLVLLNGIMITSGESIAFLADYALVSTESWRLMFATGLIPAILLLLGMQILPATPRWMVLQNKIDKARQILLNIRTTDNVEMELKEIIQSTQINTTHWSELFSQTLRPVLIIGLGLGILQQFIGINTIMYYGPTIFQAVGFQGESAQLLATFAMGMVNTVMSIVAVIIVDRIGRRRMLLGGLSVAGLSLAIVGWLFYANFHTEFSFWCTFAFMVTYIAGYTLSLGSLFWLVISEIYPLNIRGVAMSFVTAIQWGANFIVAATFLSILTLIGPYYTFWMYGMMCIIGFVFCYYLVPETRGMTLEHIENNLRSGKRFCELAQPAIMRVIQ